MPGPRLVAVCLAFALVVDGAAARAADPPAAEPPAAEPAPPTIAPAPAPPAATGLESGDTAATAAAPMAAPAAAPQVFVDRATPFYRKPWFWGTVAGVLLTAAILGTLTLGPSEAPTPQTTLGDMLAF